MSDYQIKIEPFEYVALQDIRIHKDILLPSFIRRTRPADKGRQERSIPEHAINLLNTYHERM